MESGHQNSCFEASEMNLQMQCGSPPGERRQHIRYPASGFFIMRSGEQRYKGTPVNLSLGGILFVAEPSSPEGALARMQIKVLGFDEPIHVSVKIIRTHERSTAAVFLESGASLTECIEWFGDDGKASKQAITQDDARRYSRFPLEIPVSCKFQGRTVETFGVNISRLGLFLAGPKLPAVGSQVQLRFSLGGGEQIEVNGLVRHFVYGCGVTFVETLPEDRIRLIVYLKRFSRAGC